MATLVFKLSAVTSFDWSVSNKDSGIFFRRRQRLIKQKDLEVLGGPDYNG